MNSHNTSVSVSGRRLGLRLVFAVLAAAVLTATWITPVGAAKRARPPVPVGVTAQGGGVGEVLLSWQDPGDGVTAHSYRYKAVKGSEGWVRWSRVPVGVTEVTVRGLDSGVKYRFQVRALKDSRRSHSVSVKAKPTAPPVAPLLQREDPQPDPPPDPPPPPDPEPLPDPPPEPPEEKRDIPDQSSFRDTSFVQTIGRKSYDLNRFRKALEECLLGSSFGKDGNYDFTINAEKDFNSNSGCEHHRPNDKQLYYICVQNRGIIKNDGGEVVYAPEGYSGLVLTSRGDCANLNPVKGPMCPGEDSVTFGSKTRYSHTDNCKTRSQLARARAEADTPLKCAMEWNSRWCVVNETTGAGYCAAKRVEAGFF